MTWRVAEPLELQAGLLARGLAVLEGEYPPRAKG